MIYLGENFDGYIFPNLFQYGESLTEANIYDLVLTGIETSETLTVSGLSGSPKKERYFRFRIDPALLADLSDGQYKLEIKKGEAIVASFLVYLSRKTSKTFVENTIINTYISNE